MFDYYFFDTNYLIDDKIKVPDIKITQLGCLYTKKIFITDINKMEIQNNQSPNKVIVNKIKKIISKDYFRKYFPETCPIFYNCLGWTLNPAVFLSPYFLLEKNLSVKLWTKKQQKEILESNKKFTNKLMKPFNYKKLNKQFNYNFNEKELEEDQEIDTLIRQSCIRYLAKRRKPSRKNNQKLNTNITHDAQIFSTLILFLLFHKVSVNFVTADYDFVAILYLFTESFAQACAFKILINEKINQKPLQNGEIVNININKFKRIYNNTFINNWSYNQLCSNKYTFTILFWDTKKQKYYKIGIGFSKSAMKFLKKMQGNLICPLVKNDTYNNWLIYKFQSPVVNEETIKVKIYKKDIIIKNNIKLPNKSHNKICPLANQNLQMNNYISGFCNPHQKSLEFV